MKIIFVPYFVSFFPIFFCHNCTEISTCEGISRANTSLNWTEFTLHLSSNPSISELEKIATKFGSNPAVIRECRMGLASVFFRLAIHYSSDPPRAHDLHQLAMAMVWDVSRSHGVWCLENEKIFDFFWLKNFMNIYLNLAAELRRHEDDKPTPSPVEPVGRIAIATVCDYPDPDHVLFGIEKVSKRNRDFYAKKHGYTSIFLTNSSSSTGGRHPVWSAIALPLLLLERHPEFAFVMWMDCDALFINFEEKIEKLIARAGREKDLIISEDGRGLSGGNWIVRNSNWSRKFLRSILENPSFDLFDLRDQFGLLWTLLGPSSWQRDGGIFPKYPDEVGLVPQRLINAYPFALCRPSHHCFEDGKDFIVSFITLGSQSRAFAWHLLLEFANRVDPHLSAQPTV